MKLLKVGVLVAVIGLIALYIQQSQASWALFIIGVGLILVGGVTYLLEKV